MYIVTKDIVHEPIVGHLGELIYELLGRRPELGGTTCHSLVYVVIPPGKSSEAHYHKESEETYYVLRGTAQMKVDDRMLEFLPGQACLIMPGEVHQISNIGDVDFEMLTISAPVGALRTHIFFKNVMVQLQMYLSKTS